MPLAVDILVRAFCPVKIMTENAKTQSNEHNPWPWNAWKAEEQSCRQQNETAHNAKETPDHVASRANHIGIIAQEEEKRLEVIKDFPAARLFHGFLKLRP
jgi:hypothetical protein